MCQPSIDEYSDFEAIQLLLECRGIDIYYEKTNRGGFTDGFRLTAREISSALTGRNSFIGETAAERAISYHAKMSAMTDVLMAESEHELFLAIAQHSPTMANKIIAVIRGLLRQII